MANTRKSATAAEALSNKIPFSYDGVDYELEPTINWPIEALEYLEDGKIVSFLRSVLGAEQYAAYRATSPKVSDLESFVTSLTAAFGIAGN